MDRSLILFWPRRTASPPVRTSDACYRPGPSLTVCSLAPQSERPVRQCPPRFAAGGRRKRKRFFTRAARKETGLYVRSAIMPILSEVAPYDFRP
jgi:hypothetical protein